MVKKQGAWGLWWLCIITLSVYYFVWYGRINRELAHALGKRRPFNGTAWSQIIPFYGLYALSKTAKRLNEAHARLNSPTRVSPVTTWLFAPIWFGSHTRYLQRRMNILHDIQASHSITSTPTAA